MQCFGSLWREKSTSNSNLRLRKLRKMSIEAQFDELETNQNWQKLFLVLKTKSEKEASERTTEEAKKAESKPRNRFRDVLPYDQTRVLLQPCLKKSSDYINASFVQVPDARRSYICSQGPLTSTVGHMWEMIWTHNCTTVVMLNSLIEKGMPSCASYWPQELESTMTFDDTDQCCEFTLSLVRQTENTVFVTRSLKLTRRRKDQSEVEERIIAQFHFTNWPDFGVPQCPDEFLDFLFAVRQAGCFDVKPNQQECEPVVVHCTAGIGRTGTFVLVDVCLALLSLYRAVDITTQLLELRKMRMGFVQTAEQLRFCYQAIIRGKKRINIQTPAASPSVNHRPSSLQLNEPDSPPAEPSLNPLTESGSPKSPRRELLRQDGRTPSVDVNDALQNGKRQKITGDTADHPDRHPRLLSESDPASLTGEGRFTSTVTLTDLSLPSVVNGDQLTDQHIRDSALRQKRQERAETLRKKVEAIKLRQREVEEASKRVWKPWMSIVAATGVGLVAAWVAYQKMH